MNWYLTMHGIENIPKGLQVYGVEDIGGITYFWTRVKLTPEELSYYDIKEVN